MLGWQSIDSDTKLFIFGEATRLEALCGYQTADQR
jgi:hypothetical protein